MPSPAGRGRDLSYGSSFSSALLQAAAATWSKADVIIKQRQDLHVEAAERHSARSRLTLLSLFVAISSSVLILADLVLEASYPGLSTAALLGACALLFFFIEEIPLLVKGSASSGSGLPHDTDIEDAHATVEWLAKQKADAEARTTVAQRGLIGKPSTPVEAGTWLNKLLVTLWPNAISPQLVSAIEAALLHQLWHEPPPSLVSLVVENIDLGEAAPQIVSSSGISWTPLTEPPTPGQEGITVGVEWISVGMQIALRLKTRSPGSEHEEAARLSITGISVSGTVLIVPALQGTGLLWSFLGAPALRLTADVGTEPSPGGPSPNGLTGAAIWLESCLSQALAQHAVEPRRQFIPVGSYPRPTQGLDTLPGGPLSLSLTVLSASGLLRPTATSAQAAAGGGGRSSSGRKASRMASVVVEVDCGERVVTSPASCGPAGSDPQWEETPLLLSADVCSVNETHVVLRVYEVVQASSPAVLLGSTAVNVRVFSSSTGSRSVVAWGVGPSGGAAVASIDSLGKRQNLRVALESPTAKGNYEGQIDIGFTLTPSLLAKRGKQGTAQPGLSLQPAVGPTQAVPGCSSQVLQIGVVEARGLSSSGAAGVKPSWAVRVSYGSEVKATRPVSDKAPFWGEVLALPIKSGNDAGPTVTGYSTPSGYSRSRDAGPEAAQSSTPGALPLLPRFVHLDVLETEGRWKARVAGSAVLDLWSLPDADAASLSTLWLPISSASSSAEVKLSIQRVASDAAEAAAAKTKAALKSSAPAPASTTNKGSYLAVLIEKVEDLLPPEAAANKTPSGGVYASVSVGGITRKTKVVKSVTDPVWHDTLCFDLNQSPSPSLASGIPGIEVVVREQLGMGARAIAAFRLSASAAGASGGLGRCFIPLSEIQAQTEWPFQTSVPLVQAAPSRAGRTASFLRRTSAPVTPASPSRLFISFACAPTRPAAQDLLHTIAADPTALDEAAALPNTPLPVRSAGPIPRSTTPDLSRSSAVAVPPPLPPLPSAPGGRTGLRQQQIQQSKTQLDASLAALKGALKSGSEATLNELEAAVKEQQRMMQELLRDRDMVLGKVAELRSVMAAASTAGGGGGGAGLQGGAPPMPVMASASAANVSGAAYGGRPSPVTITPPTLAPIRTK